MRRMTDMASLDCTDLFLLRASEQPGKLAVVAEDCAVTYDELAGQVRSLAAVLAEWVEPRILIALSPGADAYAAMFAAGLAGGFYTPVNLEAPEAKLRQIARLLQPNVIITDTEAGRRLAAEAPRASVIAPSETAGGIVAERRPYHKIAYVIFTSGSTGTPKGVIIPRTALAHYVAWMQAAGMFIASDRVSQYANIGFDFSVMEIYGALCAGATLFPVQGRGDRLFPARMIEREKISVWSSVPSVVSLMIQAGNVTNHHLASLRLLNFCGEPLLPHQVRAIFAARPDVLVQNTYGPTEATVSMTSLCLNISNFESACRTSVALGTAIPGMGLHLLGGSHPDEGEIVITGPQLAAGYWQDPERTAAAFRQVHVGGGVVPGYLTGDWAERENGHVFFKERIDFQVKIKGIRIELDEVAAAIRDAGWPVVCVLSTGDALAAVVEDCPGAQFDARRLAEALALRLEPQVIPRFIRLIKQMPLNDNGKIDRQAVRTWLESEGIG
jgi:D-alanine--poly(phosphoribitol) ligase subunit 1